ncbi:SMI1/KNR4 family protein (plasmid) [Rhizobium sp. K102]|nr:SMI1/KNR4 family protein [Rhizobium sp. K102]ULR47800.1 SMI1/KNR4 family protein [Rhizobium sp. K102]
MVDELESIWGIHLPTDHRAVLIESNGVQVFGGYFRLFGIGPEASIDIVKWNDPTLWKFAWETRCSDYLCFAETACGDQYAYNAAALKDGYSEVYFLDCLSMSATLLASTFLEFLQNEFLRCAKEPYDTLLAEARQIIGDLDTQEHLIYVPSPLLRRSGSNFKCPKNGRSISDDLQWRHCYPTRRGSGRWKRKSNHPIR